MKKYLLLIIIFLLLFNCQGNKGNNSNDAVPIINDTKYNFTSFSSSGEKLSAHYFRINSENESEPIMLAGFNFLSKYAKSNEKLIIIFHLEDTSMLFCEVDNTVWQDYKNKKMSLQDLRNKVSINKMGKIIQ